MALADEAVPVTLVIGDSGLGKSFAVGNALSHVQTPSVVVEATRRMSARGLAEAILREATGHVVVSLRGRVLSREELAEVVVDELYDDFTLIVIDNANSLSLKALSWLEHLHDTGAVRLALIGRPSLPEVLPESLCRDARSIRFEPIPERALSWLARQLHPIYLRSAKSTLIEVDQRYCGGVLARWALFTEHAAPICEVERIRFVNDYVASAVLHHFEELDAAA